MNPEDEKLAGEESENESESDNDSVSTTEIDQPKNPEEVDDEESIASDIDDDEEEEELESEEENDSDDEITKKSIQPPMSTQPPFSTNEESSDDEDDEEDDDENYLQKFDENIRRDIIGEYHPELSQHNDEEVETLCKIVRDAEGNIVDPLHKTVPFITKYEKARILGERAKQINSGAKPFIKIEKTLIDGYLIALREFEEKKIPFIIRRPLPNGGSEYWKMVDLEMID